MGILSIGGDGSPRDFDPDEYVTHRDEKHGEDVAEDEVSDNEVEDLAERVGPDVDAETDVRALFEHYDEVEEKHPGRGDEDGKHPDEEYHESSTPLRDLALQRPPDGKESGTIQIFVKTTLFYHSSREILLFECSSVRNIHLLLYQHSV